MDIRIAQLFVIAALLLLASCNQNGQEASTQSAATATGNAGGQTSAASDGDMPHSVAAADVIEEGMQIEPEPEPMNTVPDNWPASVPVYQNGEVVFGEAHETPAGDSLSMMIETLDPESVVSEFYDEQFEKTNCRRLDSSRGPNFFNNTYLVDGNIVDIHVRHVPDEMMEIAEDSMQQQSDFEGTLLHMQVMPAGDLGHFSDAVSWYNLNDVPPGYPSGMLPRYPESTIDMAAYGRDHYVLQAHCSDENIAPAVLFYSDLFVEQGREMTVIVDEDRNYEATFAGDDGVMHLNVVQNEAGDTDVFINIYCDRQVRQ